MEQGKVSHTWGPGIPNRHLPSLCTFVSPKTIKSTLGTCHGVWTSRISNPGLHFLPKPPIFLRVCSVASGTIHQASQSSHPDLYTCFSPSQTSSTVLCIYLPTCLSVCLSIYISIKIGSHYVAMCGLHLAIQTRLALSSQ